MIKKRIKQKRRENKITQDELAGLMKVTRQTIVGWEKGVNIPSAKYIVELSEYLDTNPNWLLGFKSEGC